MQENLHINKAWKLKKVKFFSADIFRKGLNPQSAQSTLSRNGCPAILKFWQEDGPISCRNLLTSSSHDDVIIVHSKCFQRSLRPYLKIQEMNGCFRFVPSRYLCVLGVREDWGLGCMRRVRGVLGRDDTHDNLHAPQPNPQSSLTPKTHKQRLGTSLRLCIPFWQRKLLSQLVPIAVP